MNPMAHQHRVDRAFGSPVAARGFFGRLACAAALTLAGLAISGGCSDAKTDVRIDRASTADWSQIRVRDVTVPEAYDAGLYAMRQWFRLSETDPDRGLIQSAPGEYEQKGGTGRIRDAAIGFKNRMRRTGTMVVQDYAGGCIIKCRVAVQRLDTADHRIFQSNNEFADVPNQTPIEQEASVKPSQDQVWTDMSPDRSLERQILAIVRERLTGGGPTDQPTEAAPAKQE